MLNLREVKFTIDFNGSFDHLCGKITHSLAGECC